MMTNLNPLALLLAIIAGAILAFVAIGSTDWLIKSLPSAILPGLMLVMVFILLALFALAALVRVGRLA